MTPNEIFRDFRTKYLNTFVWVKPPSGGKSILATIDAVNENRDRQAVIQLSSNEYGKLVLNFASNHELNFRFPTVGTFQYEKDSLILYRRAPHRQYQRGLGPANHMLVSCTVNIDGQDFGLNLDTIAAAFRAEKYRARDAIPMLAKGNVRSVALEGMFSLVQPLDEGTRYMLYMGTICIGRVDDELKFYPHRGADIYQDEAQRVLTEI